MVACSWRRGGGARADAHFVILMRSSLGALGRNTLRGRPVGECARPPITDPKPSAAGSLLSECGADGADCSPRRHRRWKPQPPLCSSSELPRERSSPFCVACVGCECAEWLSPNVRNDCSTHALRCDMAMHATDAEHKQLYLFEILAAAFAKVARLHHSMPRSPDIGSHKPKTL